MVSLAKQWNVGSNNITFNGNLEGIVTFAAVNRADAAPYQTIKFNHYGHSPSPKDICVVLGCGVQYQSFLLIVQTAVDGAGILRSNPILCLFLC